MHENFTDTKIFAKVQKKIESTKRTYTFLSQNFHANVSKMHFESIFAMRCRTLYDNLRERPNLTEQNLRKYI